MTELLQREAGRHESNEQWDKTSHGSPSQLRKNGLQGRFARESPVHCHPTLDLQ